MKFIREDIVKVLEPYTESTHFYDVLDGNRQYNQAHFDSREVTPESIFVAIEGENSRGINFISSAIQNGAACIIAPHDYLPSQEVRDSGVDVISVDDTLLAFGVIGKLARDTYQGDVVCVIGSVGKTTTKNILYVLGGGENIVHASKGSYNNETGVPLTLCSIDENVSRAIVELGESHFGDLDYITSLAQPHVLVVTNVALAHTEYLGDLEGVARTMHESVVYMGDTSTIVIGSDLLHKDIVLGDSPAKIIEVQAFGSENADAEYVITSIEPRPDLSHDFTMNIKGSPLTFHLPLIGRHFVMNAALAVAVSLELGDSPADVSQRMGMISSVGHRMRVVNTQSLTIFDDCYNANPASMKASMAAVAAYAQEKSQRSIFFMGEMRELGNDAAELHIDMAVYALDSGIDHLVCVSQATRAAYDAINDESRVSYYETVSSCIENLDEIVREGDAVGVKASRGPDPTCPALFPIVESLERYTPRDKG